MKELELIRKAVVEMAERIAYENVVLVGVGESEEVEISKPILGFAEKRELEGAGK